MQVSIPVKVVVAVAACAILVVSTLLRSKGTLVDIVRLMACVTVLIAVPVLMVTSEDAATTKRRLSPLMSFSPN
jgi:hypothetical protein